MYTYTYTYISIYMFINLYIHVYVCLSWMQVHCHIYVYIKTYICISTYIYTYIYPGYICVYTHKLLYIHLRMDIYVYKLCIHIYVRISWIEVHCHKCNLQIFSPNLWLAFCSINNIFWRVKGFDLNPIYQVFSLIVVFVVSTWKTFA